MTVPENVVIAAADRLTQLQAERDLLADTLANVRRLVRGALVDISVDDAIAAGAQLTQATLVIDVAQKDVAELTTDRWRHHGTPQEDAALIATADGWGNAVSPKTALALIAARRRQSLREHGLELLRIHGTTDPNEPNPHTD